MFPWHRIFDYKDELNNHFEEITERIRMVENGELNMQAAENLNAKSLVRFNAILTKLLRENNISKAFYVQFESTLRFINQLENQLKAENNVENINKESIDKINL